MTTLLVLLHVLGLILAVLVCAALAMCAVVATVWVIAIFVSWLAPTPGRLP